MTLEQIENLKKKYFRDLKFYYITFILFHYIKMFLSIKLFILLVKAYSYHAVFACSNCPISFLCFASPHSDTSGKNSMHTLSSFPCLTFLFNLFPIGFQTSHFTWMALEEAKTLAVSHPLSWNPFSETSSWLSPSLSLPHFARVRAILITTSKVLPPLCIVFQITLNYFPSTMYNHIAYFIFYVICLSVTPNILSVILNSYLL